MSAATKQNVYTAAIVVAVVGATLTLLAWLVPSAEGQLLRRSRPSLQRTSSSGRYCQNPNCQMCNRLFGLMPGYAYVNGRVTYVGRQTRPPAEAGKPDLPAIDATPQAIVDIMLLMARLKPDDVLLDPGCGDGRFVVTAAERYGCRAVGIEIDPETADKAEQSVRQANAGDRVLIIRGDARRIRLDSVTVVVLYMFPKDIEVMRHNWPNARIVLSYLHKIPGVENHTLPLTIDGQEHEIHFWMRG